MCAVGSNANVNIVVQVEWPARDSAQGCRRIGMIEGRPQIVNDNRRHGYMDALRVAGLASGSADGRDFLSAADNRRRRPGKGRVPED